MKTEMKKVSRLGNGVAFLCGAMLNITIGIIQSGITESEWYLLLAATIGGVVWVLLNILYQRIKSHWFNL